MFTELLERVKLEVVSLLARVRIRSEQEVAEAEAADVQRDLAQANIGRNDPCPCGSGKKYKYCHGKLS